MSCCLLKAVVQCIFHCFHVCSWPGAQQHLRHAETRFSHCREWLITVVTMVDSDKETFTSAAKSWHFYCLQQYTASGRIRSMAWLNRAMLSPMSVWPISQYRSKISFKSSGCWFCSLLRWGLQVLRNTWVWWLQPSVSLICVYSAWRSVSSFGIQLFWKTDVHCRMWLCRC